MKRPQETRKRGGKVLAHKEMGLDAANAKALNEQLKPHFKPLKPTHGTQADRLLAVLIHGSTINPLQGWLRLGIYRLADTVFQLRRLGWPVITDRIEVQNRFGETCRVALYRLEVRQ